MMKFRLTLALLLFSSLVFSQRTIRGAIVRVQVAQQERKRQKAEQEQRKDTTRLVQDGNAVSTWIAVVTPGEKTAQWRMIRSATYNNGELNGPYLELDERGDTATTGSYYHGRYCGEWKSYHDGKIWCIRNYDSLGNKTGLQLVTDANGQVINRQFYTSQDNYYWWSYCENGSLLWRGAMSAKGREGIWYEYRCAEETVQPQDTLPVQISQWRNGKPDGFSRQYSRGVPVTEWNYRNGLPNGICRKYENGVVREETSYIDNIQNGEHYVYSATGKLQEMSGYVMGTPDGEHVIFDTVTNVKVDAEVYDMGIVLRHERRTPEGKLIYSRQLISEDSLYYRITEYYENGKVKSRTRTVEGDRTGKYEEWYANGRKKSSVSCFLDHVHGPVYAWNERGILVYRTTADFDDAGSDEMVWDDNGKRLESTTPECDSQAAKYAPAGLRLFTEYGYQYKPVVMKTRNVYRKATDPAPIILIEDIEFVRPSDAPQFPGGEEERIKWFQANLRYPVMERDAGMQGSDYVRFTVNADSTISDVKIVRSVPGASGFDKELVRVTRQMPKWKPATRNGKPIRSRCVMGVIWVIE